MVACNRRDREAAHRAENEGIATRDVSAVTCAKCRQRLFAAGRESRRRSRSPLAAPATFRVRAATVADQDALVEQRLAVFAETQGLAAGTEPAARLARATRSAFVAGLERGSASVWLAVTPAGEVAGSAALHVFERLPSPSNPVPCEGYVSHVFVSAGWRRRGVGTALLRAVVAGARQRGLRRIRLHATESGRALYETVGFRLRSNDMDLTL